MSGAAAVPLTNWSFSLPNLVVLGSIIAVLWYKLHLLRLSLMERIDAAVVRLEVHAPPYPVGERFLEAHFDDLRQDLRELRVRVEHVERLLGADGNGGASPGG